MNCTVVLDWKFAVALGVAAVSIIFAVIEPFLHPLVIIPTFLFPLYFIQGEVFVTGTLLHIYAIQRSADEARSKVVSR